MRIANDIVYGRIKALYQGDITAFKSKLFDSNDCFKVIRTVLSTLEPLTKSNASVVIKRKLKDKTLTDAAKIERAKRFCESVKNIYNKYKFAEKGPSDKE